MAGVNTIKLRIAAGTGLAFERNWHDGLERGRRPEPDHDRLILILIKAAAVRSDMRDASL